MPVLVKLFGILRDKASNNGTLSPLPAMVEINSVEVKTVLDILRKLDINESEISHIYVNSRYCGPGNEIKDGDRVGIFPKRMAIMFAEIPHLNSVPATVMIKANVRDLGALKMKLDVPIGSTLNTLIQKYHVVKKNGQLKIIVNGLPETNFNYVINPKDEILLYS